MSLTRITRTRSPLLQVVLIFSGLISFSLWKKFHTRARVRNEIWPIGTFCLYGNTFSRQDVDFMKGPDPRTWFAGEGYGE